MAKEKRRGKTQSGTKGTEEAGSSTWFWLHSDIDFVIMRKQPASWDRNSLPPPPSCRCSVLSVYTVPEFLPQLTYQVPTLGMIDIQDTASFLRLTQWGFVGVDGLGKCLEQHCIHIVLGGVGLWGLTVDMTFVPPDLASESCIQVLVSHWKQHIAHYGPFALECTGSRKQVSTGSRAVWRREDHHQTEVAPYLLCPGESSGRHGERELALWRPQDWGDSWHLGWGAPFIISRSSKMNRGRSKGEGLRRALKSSVMLVPPEGEVRTCKL